MGLVVLRHVGFSRTRGRTHVPCIDRQILNHCTTREVPILLFFSGSRFEVFVNLITLFLFIIYLAVPGLSCTRGMRSCGIRALSCGMWDLVP